MDQWKDKVAVVTGASAGIGAETVKALANAGLRVVGFARRPELVENLTKQVKCGKIYAVKVDITNEADVIKAFKWVTDKVGPISILINNAGVMTRTSLINGDTDKWKQILDTNVLGLTIASREAIKIMRANNINGNIININSQAGHRVINIPNLNLYEASKHAVTALTETLRLELIRLGSKIKITSLSPGYVKTELLSANGILTDEEVAKILTHLKPLNPIDIANGILYVLGTPPHVQVTELSIIPVGEHI